MCRRINSLSRKVRISVLRFRKRWQRSLANFLLIGIRNQFPRFEIFIFTRVPMLTFLFRLNSLLDGRSLAVRLLHLGLVYFTQKNILSFGQPRPTDRPCPQGSPKGYDLVPNVVPSFSHLPAPWNEVAWSSGSSPLFKMVGVFNRLTKED